MTAWETAVCQRAIDAYGKDHQLIICMEEMAELTKELSKNLRGHNNLQEIAEEVADVEVMLEQVKLIFHLREAAIEAKEAKLLRLRERIIKDTGKQDYSTSLCRKWLDEHTAKTVRDAVFLTSSHELKNPE
ncbi:hypothetical protein [Faecalibacterium sp. An192]|uniref:hypothetical protein n=1 Tax=Faecalibacterium sp. An192 TaxID=1965581 RepID=UPI000B3ADF31|nr:hypothetical protein [Faecalibacterium sp. An192]OUP27334.1 hypothetical protein B5F27_10385 [Faecalibacterium sp. An192]